MRAGSADGTIADHVPVSILVFGTGAIGTTVGAQRFAASPFEPMDVRDVLAAVERRLAR